MRLGIGSYTFPWAIGLPGQVPERPLRAVDLLDRAAALGVSVVQVADNLPLDRLSAPSLDAFAARAGKLRIDVEVGTRGIGREHLLSCLRLAKRLGSSIVRVVVDTADHRPDEDEIVATIRDLLPAFEMAGVVIAIENYDRFAASALAAILERLDSPYVGVCLDTVNSFGALEGPDVVVDALGPWVINLHVKDFGIRRAVHKMGFVIEGRPAGQGRLNVPWLLGRLRDLGRDPNAILELWTPPQKTLAATIAKEEAWARASIRYLRQFVSR